MSTTRHIVTSIKEADAIVASNIVFWLVLDPCFEWAGSARVDGRGLGSGARHHAAHAPQEAAAGDRGEEAARPGQEPEYRAADSCLGGRGMAARLRAISGKLEPKLRNLIDKRFVGTTIHLSSI